LVGLVVGKAATQVAGGTASDGNAAGVNAKLATEFNYLKHDELGKLTSKLAGCGGDINPAQCRQNAVDDAKQLSLIHDSELLTACGDASSSSCRQHIDSASKYAVDQVATTIVKEDQSRSANVFLQQVFSSEDGNKFFDNITERKEFFEALGKSLREKGNEVAWVDSAAKVSDQLENLKICSSNVWCAVENYSWMEKTGSIILSKRWTDLKDLFQRIDPIAGDAAKNWDSNILMKEQYQVQDQYKDLSFDKFKAIFTGAFFNGVDDITNPEDRIKKGEELMEKIRDGVRK
ncbi:hypothetical protein ACVBEF_21090, partial [Glaciimonas sp. GG7]